MTTTIGLLISLLSVACTILVIGILRMFGTRMTDPESPGWMGGCVGVAVFATMFLSGLVLAVFGLLER